MLLGSPKFFNPRDKVSRVKNVKIISGMIHFRNTNSMRDMTKNEIDPFYDFQGFV